MGVSSFVFTIIITHCVNQQCAILLIISRAHVLVISTMSRVKCTFNTWRTVVSGTWKYDNPRLTRLRPHVTFSTSGHHNFHVTRTTVSYVLSYGQLQQSWIISGLQWRNVNEYRLPCKNAHSPNYCSWLAVCVNYSANFYCKIALINRFKLYLIKTYSMTPKNKLNVNKNNVEYILRFI